VEGRTGLQDAGLLHTYIHRNIIFEPPEQKRMYSGVDFVYEHKERARAPRKNTEHPHPSLGSAVPLVGEGGTH
jgi:hypothetical protein